MRILTAAMLVGCLLFTAPAFATTRYVDLTLPGSCSNGSTTYDPVTEACGSGSATIYNTVAGAVAPTVSGDTIYLRTGTFITRITFSGKVFTSATTLSGYPGDTVTYAPSFAAGTQAITVVNWLVIQDMTISGANGPDDNTNSVKGMYISGPDNWTIQRTTITGFHYHGIYFEGADNVTIQDNIIHAQVSTTCVAGTRWYGIYYHHGNNALIRRNQIYNNPGGGIQVYPGPIVGLDVRRNTIRENTTCSTSPVGGMIVAADSTGGNISGVKIYYNEIYGNGPGGTGGDGGGIRLYATGGKTQVGTEIISNTVYNNLANAGTAYGISIEAGPSGTIVKNNISLANESGQYLNAGSGTVESNNKTTGTITDCTISTSNFRQKAGSSCLNAGVAVTGYAFNGAAPDQGAYELPVFASCVVEDGSATTLRITFTNNMSPPLLPASGITGFTARKAGANNVITAAVVSGDNLVHLTLTDAIVNGNAVDISYSGSGNLTDSALIGNTLHQPYNTVLTNQACTNNVGAAATHVFTQAAFRFHSLRGTEATPVGTPYATAPENSNILVRVGGSVRLRLALTCTTADCPPTGFYPRYSRNAGAYTVIPDVFAADNIAFCGTSPDPDIPTNGTSTTAQLSTAGAFAAGALVRTSNAIPTVDIALNGKTELEYCIAFDTDATAGDTYDVRLYQQDGTVLNAYTVTPRITIAAERAGMGF